MERGRAELEEFHRKLKRYRDLVVRDSEDSGQVKKRENLREDLIRDRAWAKRMVIDLVGRVYVEDVLGRRHDAWNESFDETDSMISYQEEALDRLVGSVNEAIGRLEVAVLDSSASPSAKPWAFIAHGGDSRALTKLKEFLDAVGVEPLVVEKRPSQGRSVNANVEHYLKQADCAIVLATKGDIDGKTGGFLPRGNVLVETGRFQERFSGKIIYLLEGGTQFPSNISEKVWESFTQSNMEKAFIKIAKELRAFGVIETRKPDK